MSKGPLRELNRNSKSRSHPKLSASCSDEACSGCPSSVDSGKVKGRDSQPCAGDHDGYCSDENCLTVSEFSQDIPEPEMCYKCGKHGCRLKRCSRCKSTLYCSRECQKKDWQKHKKICKIPDGGQDDLKTLLRQLTSTLAPIQQRK